MSKTARSAPRSPISERALWAWLLLVCGVVCWLIAAGWIFRAHLDSDTSQNIYSGFGLGFFILGLGPLALSLAMWLRTARAGRNAEF